MLWSRGVLRRRWVCTWFLALLEEILAGLHSSLYANIRLRKVRACRNMDESISTAEFLECCWRELGVVFCDELACLEFRALQRLISDRLLLCLNWCCSVFSPTETCRSNLRSVDTKRCSRRIVQSLVWVVYAMDFVEHHGAWGAPVILRFWWHCQGVRPLTIYSMSRLMLAQITETLARSLHFSASCLVVIP